MMTPTTPAPEAARPISEQGNILTNEHVRKLIDLDEQHGPISGIHDWLVYVKSLNATIADLQQRLTDAGVALGDQAQSIAERDRQIADWEHRYNAISEEYALCRQLLLERSNQLHESKLHQPDQWRAHATQKDALGEICLVCRGADPNCPRPSPPTAPAEE